ncbi:putative DNA polymerase III subunit alpha [Vibrio coralliirubri]|uniref:DNA polymerase III subunit alpha n=1 Tax=Vibrio coralliirubri TaxID=1516159 RepID=UPI00062FBB8A|nr:DNA polymerase III subunit alpha [Vibrio coralliirubri]CDT53708.1 putative DNA polymerase III subunit alpha [Vibrio coralliirubri]
MEQIKNYIGGRTHFSLSQSILAPEELVTEASTYEYESVTIADFNSINALVKAFRTAKEKDIKVCFGAAVKVVDDLTWRRAKRGEPRRKPNPFFMPKLIIKNDAGLKDVIELLSMANNEDHFYFEPQLSLEEVVEVVKRGNLIMTTGDIHSLFSHKNHTAILEYLGSHLDSSLIRYELIPVKTAYNDRVNDLIASVALDSDDTELIISRPTMYKKDDDKVRNTMCCILNRNTVEETWRLEPATSDMYVVQAYEFEAELKGMHERLLLRGHDTNDIAAIISKGISGTNALSEFCSYEWHKLDICLPHMSDTPYKTLVNLTKDGWKERISKPTMGYMPPKEKLPEYVSRLKYELGVLHKMGFEDYFLLVHKVVNWSKDNGIEVGPARGSCAGSLVAFLMGITDVDPLRFGLIFERFINPSRIDLPDIDLDFMSSRRDEVINWLREEYGNDYVCGISNYGELGTSSSLRSVAKAHGLTESQIECSKQVPKVHGSSVSLEEAYEQVPAIQQFADEHMQIFKEACSLQGTFRNYGQHAAGIIVAGEPIKNRAVVERRAGGSCSNWDKRTVEDWGLIKLDILGLSTLDMLKLGKEYVKEATGQEIDYLNLPLDDKKVLESFGKGDTIATFQFEGGNARKLLKQAGSEEMLSFEDIAAISALNRPGPLETGMTEMWVDIKRGYCEPDYPIPSLEPVLEETYGQMVYQEQTMKVAQTVAGFSMAEADSLRKAIGKKDMAAMSKIRESFINGATEGENPISEHQAVKVWGDIEANASYQFNKSHAIAYTLISYWTQWLKVQHPAAFYASALTILKEEKYPGIVRDANSKGILIMPPDVNKSSGRFEISYDAAREKTVLYTPFDKVKGLSGKALESIKEAKVKAGGKFESVEEFLSLVNKRSVNKRIQANLDEIGAFASLDESQQPAMHPERLKAQKVLLPGLVVENLKSDRNIKLGKEDGALLVEVLKEARTCCEETAGRSHPKPYLPKRAKFVVVTDAPTWTEVEKGQMTEGKGYKPVIEAMQSAGLKRSDAYHTAFLKSEKNKGEKISNQMAIDYGSILDKELEILKPSVVVALGSVSIRHLAPDVKGSWEELAGQSHYCAKRDMTILFGINPAMLYFEPARASYLENVFEQTADII